MSAAIVDVNIIIAQFMLEYCGVWVLPSFIFPYFDRAM